MGSSEQSPGVVENGSVGRENHSVTPVDDDDFVSQLLEQIPSAMDGSSESHPDYMEESFTAWAADLLQEKGFLGGFEQTVWQHIPPTGTPLKVNGFHYDEAEGRVALIVSDWDPDASTSNRMSKRDIERLIGLGTAFLDASLRSSGDFQKGLEPARPHADFARQLWDQRDNIRRIELFVLINRLGPETKLDDRMLGDVRLVVDVWDAKRLVRVNDGRMGPQPDLAIDFVKDYGGSLACIPAPASDPRYSAFLTVIPAEVLAKIYDQYGPRVLEENVRAYLQLKGGVNRGIRKTLLEEPGSFFAYNNGLSATVQHVDVESGSDGFRIRSLVGLQIVNGAQTTGSIHRAWRTDKANLSKVFVPVKITCVMTDAHTQIVSNISLCANSQNAVRVDDFSSNGKFYVRLEELSRRIWSPTGRSRWYFERTRGQYQDEIGRASRSDATKFKNENPSAQRFAKSDVAKYVFAWDQRPDRVSLGSQKNFIHFSEEWLRTRGDDWLPDDVWYRAMIAKAIIYNTIRVLVRTFKLPGYSGNVVAYMTALLAAKVADRVDLEAIWSQQQLSPRLSDVLSRWIKPIYDALVATSNGRNVTEWAKKPTCWAALSNIQLEPLPPSTPEIRDGAGGGQPGQLAQQLTAGIGGSLRGETIPFDATEDRERLLRVARTITNGRVMKREDAIKELQVQLGIQRLSAEKRGDLESILDDLPRIAFIDDPETVRTNAALAIVRKLARAGIETREDLYRNLASEWMNAKRVGSKIRADIDVVLKLARRRRIVDFDREAVVCPTPTFEAYDDLFLTELILELVSRKGRIYFRRMIAEAAIEALGFSNLRADMLSRLETAIETMVAKNNLNVPAEGALQRA